MINLVTFPTHMNLVTFPVYMNKDYFKKNLREAEKIILSGIETGEISICVIGMFSRFDISNIEIIKCIRNIEKQIIKSNIVSNIIIFDSNEDMLRNMRIYNLKDEFKSYRTPREKVINPSIEVIRHESYEVEERL